MKSQIIRILPPVLLDVGLPTLDVYTDISLILGWYIAGHFNYAMAMTTPLIAQFILTAIKWYQIERSMDDLFCKELIIIAASKHNELIYV